MMRFIIRHLIVTRMRPRARKVCEVCVKTFSGANVARHKRLMHTYCMECKKLVSRKRHDCFISDGVAPKIVPYPPNDEDQFLLVHVPVLIRKQLYKKLDSDGSVWPLYDLGEKEELADKVKKNLTNNCITCTVSEYIDIPDDRHSCTDPNREEFVKALSQFTDKISDSLINDVYRAAFGGLVL